MNPVSTERFAVVGAVCGVMALLVSLGGVAVGQEGSDVFSDIAGSPFRDQINRIGRAGCASGFSDGTFRPRSGVTRQQFAFWTNNCGGRVAFDFVEDFSMAGGLVTPMGVGLTAGATDSGEADGGFVLVTASVDFIVPTADLGDCPCRVEVLISDVAGSDLSGERVASVGGTADGTGTASTTVSVTAVFPIDAGQTKQFLLVANSSDPQFPDIALNGDMAAVYIPFGADGDRSLDVEPP